MTYERDDYMRRQEMDHDLIRQRRPDLHQQLAARERAITQAAARAIKPKRIRDSYPMADMMNVEAEEAAKRDDLTPAHEILKGLGSAAVVYLVVALFTFAWMAS